MEVGEVAYPILTLNTIATVPRENLNSQKCEITVQSVQIWAHTD